MKRHQQDHCILTHIMSVKADQPNWGYRLVWAYLKYQMDLPFNKKRIYRIMIPRSATTPARGTRRFNSSGVHS